MKEFILIFILSTNLLSGSNPEYTNTGNDLEISSSSKELVDVFNWAKQKAQSFVQTGKRGPVNLQGP